MTPTRYYSVSEICRYSGLSDTTIRREIKLGHLATETKNKPGKILISQQAVIDWLTHQHIRCETIQPKQWLKKLTAR